MGGGVRREGGRVGGERRRMGEGTGREPARVELEVARERGVCKDAHHDVFEGEELALVAADPVKSHLLEGRLEPAGLGLDGERLQDGSEGGHANARRDEEHHLVVEDFLRRGAVGTVHEDLARQLHRRGLSARGRSDNNVVIPRKVFCRQPGPEPGLLIRERLAAALAPAAGRYRRVRGPLGRGTARERLGLVRLDRVGEERLAQGVGPVHVFAAADVHAEDLALLRRRGDGEGVPFGL